jgi:transcription antitermination factor NusG
MLAPLRPPIPINLDQLEARILGRQAGMHWYTLIIEPQSWRRVAERADEMGYATYCPMGIGAAARVVRGARTLPDIARPLMPGYLFVDMPGLWRRFDLFTPSEDNGEPVYGCRGFLSIDGSPMALHEAVIEGIRLREKNGEFDLTGLTEDGRHRVPKWAKRASTVEFIKGPFAGFFGTVVKAVSATMIEIAVTIFGRSSNVRAPLDWVRVAR